MLPLLPFVFVGFILWFFASASQIPTESDGTTTEGDTTPADTTMSASLQYTHPDLLQWLQQVQQDMPGQTFNVVSATRTYAEQNKLYSYGRTVVNPYSPPTPDKPFGGIATNAKGGQSPHQIFSGGYSHAIDVNPGKMTVEEYTQMGLHAEAWGFVWGGRFTFSDGSHDYGHIETKQWRTLAPDPSRG